MPSYNCISNVCDLTFKTINGMINGIYFPDISKKLYDFDYNIYKIKINIFTKNIEGKAKILYDKNERKPMLDIMHALVISTQLNKAYMSFMYDLKPSCKINAEITKIEITPSEANLKINDEFFVESILTNTSTDTTSKYNKTSVFMSYVDDIAIEMRINHI